MASKKKMDRAREYINAFLSKTQNSRKFTQLVLLQFGNLQYIETHVGTKIDIRLYRDGADQVYSYWLTAAERRPIIVKMLQAGMRQAQVAKLLKFSQGTINKDVRYMRLTSPQLLENVAHLRPLKINPTVSHIKPPVGYPTPRRIKEINQTGVMVH